MYEYDADFYRYISRGAVESAQVVIPALLDALPVRIGSVLDVGCGAGAWLSVWKSHGARVVGLDGDYVGRDELLIDGSEFRAADLASDFALGEKFDLVQCLEVAEHLPSEAAAGFVARLCRHADMVLFSAAPPGQGGENHINEQPYDYWRAHFRQQGFAMYDPLRRAVAGQGRVKPWYRYNTFLYVSNRCGPELLSPLCEFRIGEEDTAADIAPGHYRLRKRIVSLLPVRVSTWLAILKKRLFGISLKLGNWRRRQAR